MFDCLIDSYWFLCRLALCIVNSQMLHFLPNKPVCLFAFSRHTGLFCLILIHCEHFLVTDCALLFVFRHIWVFEVHRGYKLYSQVCRSPCSSTITHYQLWRRVYYIYLYSAWLKWDCKRNFNRFWLYQEAHYSYPRTQLQDGALLRFLLQTLCKTESIFTQG